MKKFHQTTMSKILNEYHTMRSNLSLVTVFYIIQFFKLRNILELGFYQGQTFGVMLEASEENTNLTAIDIEYQLDLYDRHYSKTNVVKEKNVTLLKMSSLDFISSEKYDFINVDTGMSEYDSHATRTQDLMNAANLIDRSGILMLDNYRECDGLINDFLHQHQNLAPFLMDNQAIYFHNNEHDATEFLDNFLVSILPEEFVSQYNIDYKGHTVKQLFPTPIHIESMPELFAYYCSNRNF
jgi:hypothetical protein